MNVLGLGFQSSLTTGWMGGWTDRMTVGLMDWPASSFSHMTNPAMAGQEKQSPFWRGHDFDQGLKMKDVIQDRKEQPLLTEARLGFASK